MEINQGKTKSSWKSPGAKRKAALNKGMEIDGMINTFLIICFMKFHENVFTK